MNNQMNIPEVEKNIEKARIYRNEMSMNISDLLHELRNINGQYQSDNTRKLNEIGEDFYSILKKMDNGYYDKEVELNNTIKKYEETAIEAKINFNDIETNIK